MLLLIHNKIFYYVLIIRREMAFRTSDNLAYISENTLFVVPGRSKQIFISMVAGGGRGGSGSIEDGLFVTGGGGGAGGACSRIPFFNDGCVSFDCRIGKGGDIHTLDGGNTEVDVYIDSVYDTTYSVKGGKHANGKIGGVGGRGYYTFNGFDGENGIVSDILPDVAGDGGASMHFNGGNGMTKHTRNNSRTNGNCGSGGGGGLPGADPLNIGNGGNGFIVIEYI
jgi:hypothetical protein